MERNKRCSPVDGTKRTGISPGGPVDPESREHSDSITADGEFAARNSRESKKLQQRHEIGRGRVIEVGHSIRGWLVRAKNQ